jgi:hypothetical protein
MKAEMKVAYGNACIINLCEIEMRKYQEICAAIRPTGIEIFDVINEEFGGEAHFMNEARQSGVRMK